MAHKTKVTKNFLLYISNLPYSTSESSLLDQVSQFGHVLNIKLVSGTFFSQAWVTFTTLPSVQEALISLNGKKDSNFSIRCRYQTRIPDDYRLYLSNLPLNCTYQDIGELFKDYGPLITYSINKIEDSIQGFVQFESLSQMNLAISNLNLTKISTNLIKLEKFQETSHKKDYNGVNLQGFPLWFTKHDLKKQFENFLNIPYSAIQEKSGNVFGFISCKSPEDAITSILMFDSLTSGNYELKAQGVKFKLSNKAEEDSQGDGWPDHLSAQVLSSDESLTTSEEDSTSFVLYVKNLHPSMNKARLADLCQEYGAVQVDMDQVENIRYEGGDLGIRKEMLCSGTAQVKFRDYETAARAMYALRNKCVEGVRLHVTLNNHSQAKTFNYRPKQYNPYQYSRSFQAARGFYCNQFKGPYFKGKNFNHRPFPLFRPTFPVQACLNPPPAAAAAVVSILPCPVGFNAKPQVRADAGLLESSKSTDSDELELTSGPLGPSRQDLGQSLYPEVVKLTNSDLAGKITGMILELDVQTIQNLVSNPPALAEMVKNAIQVLRNAWAGQSEQLSRLAAIS